MEGQTPALPAKQHRSHSFSRSSVESDSVSLSPVQLQHQNYTYNDVFPEPTDCYAAQCPIHQRYDPSQHQVRFFSDGTPPPVPKKSLARTLSLPGTSVPPHSPLSPRQRHPQHFDNPVYMLGPIPDTYFHEETEDFKPDTSTVPLLPFSQLSFDTPDEHLPYLFSHFDNQRVVSQGIQHRHLLFLRSMAQSLEAEILLQKETTERGISSYQPQDFLLCEGCKPKQIGDTVYYSLHSPKFPGRVLGLRICKESDEAPSAHTDHHSSHVNVQDVIVHFQPSNILWSDAITSQSQDPCRTAPKPPGGDNTEDTITLPSVQSLLQKGHRVSIERDLPCVTLEDFVQDSNSLQCTEGLVYDRQVCILLLQILMGTQHLYNTAASAAELRPRDILLVWPSREKHKGENKLEEESFEWKRGLKTSRSKKEMEWEKTEKKGRVQMLWRMHGSARVVLTLQSSTLSAPHHILSIKSQIRALIQYCLPPQENPTSLYHRGLLYLCSVLQNESSGPQIAKVVAMLQVLLWGPHVPLFNHRGSMTTAVYNWLSIKRALLVMKLAERGLFQDQSVLDWEDCMCLQYLSFTDPETVVTMISQLWPTVEADMHSQ
uniref:pseudopodium-enriched atypical kinase 1 n=1 Tax=Monopterus albus TaxID=43700 RepID=UPI0009B4BCE3|nr:pseudopodium-enriched atypical kinase 1-like [Monopterus albus]